MKKGEREKKEKGEYGATSASLFPFLYLIAVAGAGARRRKRGERKKKKKEERGTCLFGLFPSSSHPKNRRSRGTAEGKGEKEKKGGGRRF